MPTRINQINYNTLVIFIFISKQGGKKHLVFFSSVTDYHKYFFYAQVLCEAIVF